MKIDISELDITIDQMKLMRSGENISKGYLERIPEEQRTEEQQQDIRIYTAEIGAFDNCIRFLELLKEVHDANT